MPDTSDYTVFGYRANDRNPLVRTYINYTHDHKTYGIVNGTWNGSFWIAYIPPQPPSIVHYSIVAIDIAGNKGVWSWEYVVNDVHKPIIYNISVSSRNGLYVDEIINISVVALENINSNVSRVECKIYHSDNNISWELLDILNLDFEKMVDISIYRTVDGELELYNVSSEWRGTYSVDHEAYLKLVINVTDIDRNFNTTVKYLKIERRSAEIIAHNITTRYGDKTDIVFCVFDLINSSVISMYFELYIDDELAYYGYTNSTGNTTIIHTFMDVRVFELRIYIPETQQYVGTEYVFYVTVLKEVLEPVFVLDALQLDTFRFYYEVRDDEGEFVYGCEIWIFINISGKWYLVASEIRENPYEGYLKPALELENGVYELWVCIYGGEYYKNYNTTLTLYIRKTTFNKIYLSNNTKLGQNISGEYTVWDPDGITNCSVDIYDPYGRKYEPYYNIG